MKKGFLLIAIVFAMGSLLAQLPVPRNMKKSYEKGFRSRDGLPGPHYWQNKGTYDIDVSFDPDSRLIKGKETILYVNNSPDTLHEIVFKLYPNIYKKGAPRMKEFESPDIGDGMKIESIAKDGKPIPESAYKIQFTNMILKIEPLLPGNSATFQVSFSYVLNQTSHMRTGQVEEGSHFVAYFFPRIAVYDDIDGWNRNPYLATQEFYNDFCDFKTSVQVPHGFLVWATGDHINRKDIFSDKYFQRIQRAEKEDGFINIIDSSERKDDGITNGKGPQTWVFEAKNVTDMVFATSDHYMWQSSSLVVDNHTGRRTRVDAVFNPAHKDYFNVVSDARKTVESMSFRFPKWPFPYPHITIFDGLDQMEYPMMVNDNPVESREEGIELTDHEIFHTMFPFYMGINETKYGWMDEGWATIGEWLISPMIDSSIIDTYGMERYNLYAGTETDHPIMSLSTQQEGMNFFLNSYAKPGMGYLYVKDMLGDDLFHKALHYYIRNWNGKHPLPLDFFNSMNEGCGKNLNWFWKRWFYDPGFPDMAIENVKSKGNKKSLVIRAKGTKPLPIDLSIHYSDGSVQQLHRDISVWEKGNNTVSILFTSPKKIKSILLGSTYIPDVDKSDNYFEIK